MYIFLDNKIILGIGMYYIGRLICISEYFIQSSGEPHNPVIT